MINSSSTIQRFNDSTKGISVIICCHNSEALIAKTLDHLFHQELTDDLKLEIILVDNASTDKTQEIAKKTAYTYDTESDQIVFRTVTESTLGLTQARFTGALNATHDLLIFCDDDNYLAPDYCLIANQIMRSDATIGACGGCGEPIFESGGAPDIVKELSLSFAWGPQAPEEGYLKSYTLYGAGLIIRKKVFEQLKLLAYEPLLQDRSGTELTSGGDEELTIWTRLMGYQLYYTPTLKFQHFIKESRLTQGYITRLYHGFGQTLGRLVPLQIIYFNQESTFKAYWPYQYIKWSLIALKHCLDYSKPTTLRKLDCLCNKQRLRTLWGDRNTYGKTLQYLVNLKQEVMSYEL